MGIDFAYPNRVRGNAPSWSYGGFMEFRTELAKNELGIDLRSMDGFRRDGESGNNWNPYEGHPLYPLLNHSDCDGELTPLECFRVAPALAAAVPRLSDEYDREKATQLAIAMIECIAHNEPLKFT